MYRRLLVSLAFTAITLLPSELAFAEDPAVSSDAPHISALERGRAMQLRIYEDIGQADDPWQRMAQEQLFGTIWTRPGLSIKERRLIALTVAASMDSPVGVAAHFRGGLKSGDFSEKEFWEWLIQFTYYAGYPKAANAWLEYRKVLAERGSLPFPTIRTAPKMPSSTE